jgi:hypothetical protein
MHIPDTVQEFPTGNFPALDGPQQWFCYRHHMHHPQKLAVTVVGYQ